jgi:hypothetical protein
VTLVPFKSTQRTLFHAVKCFNASSSIPGQNSSPSRSIPGRVASTAKLLPENFVCPSFRTRNCRSDAIASMARSLMFAGP